ncbi:uncharacterized protein PHALS_01745 [Plasmopara halstedii]|uniref:Uncharacterized protein n=1 Tax=Plasmopara halstedii TaxID=4781 RepID=A0A0N7L6X0_PLAHL|nr:uncharacterized protein PHALS_01745 [Plasmopara halstedii]CEG45451.1 hypothetical protein PHALS_01745 [Plasmopara halstedii]|eukprot:XP_024581820.1 hypothetical protein PHALS_01745 [Plasmopara halstedii]
MWAVLSIKYHTALDILTPEKEVDSLVSVSRADETSIVLHVKQELKISQWTISLTLVASEFLLIAVFQV